MLATASFYLSLCRQPTALSTSQLRPSNRNPPKRNCITPSEGIQGTLTQHKVGGAPAGIDTNDVDGSRRASDSRAYGKAFPAVRAVPAGNGRCCTNHRELGNTTKSRVFGVETVYTVGTCEGKGGC